MSLAAESPRAVSLGETHSRRDLRDPERWTMYVSHYDYPVKRLIVFVHGFLGKTVTTWLDFPHFKVDRSENIWWRESDLLFVGYQSTRDDVTGVANRIRQNLDHFYPNPPHDILTAGSMTARPDITSPYDELIVVGHSLGGLILRRALSDAAQLWIDGNRAVENRPILLTAQNRMFSPASAGFRAAGLLGVARAVPFWHAVEMVLRRASAYTDLQPDSTILREIQRRTIKMAPDSNQDLAALRANIVWASPDNVVIADRYTTDFVDSSWDGATHSSICKPATAKFEMPWTFVRTGVPQ